MPRNRVAPYEERSDEVRGKDAVIKHLRLEDAKSAPFPTLFSRLPDGCFGYKTDSGHFAIASLGSYPATISRTTRVLRHVLANALCYITSLINKDCAKHRLRGLMPRNRVAPYEVRSTEVRECD